MSTKSKNRTQAERLRRENGLSYREISDLTGISKSTLSNWLRNVPLTPTQQNRIQKRVQANRSAFAARAWRINRERFRRAREEAFRTGAECASNLPDDGRVDELALAMLYLGEGDKTGNRIQIASMDPNILRYFLWALLKLYGIGKADVAMRLNLGEGTRSRELEMIRWWSRELSCSAAQFKKTQFDARSTTAETTQNYHGVCTLTYNDTYLYERLSGVYTTYIHRRICQREKAAPK